MRLGARWQAGEAPHPSVPPELHDAIAAQEAAHPDAASWTLTWLEGRPRCSLEDLVTVSLDSAGRVRASGSLGDDEAEDDWLI